MRSAAEFPASAGVDLAYGELRRLAEAYLRGANGRITLEPAAVVHEAYLRLAGWEGVHWKSRSHFIGVAALLMRQVVWMHARRRNALKRGGGAHRVTLHSQVADPMGTPVDALLLEEALRRLEAESPDACRVVEMRVFGGLTITEIAAVTSQSESTVKRRWMLAKTWLKRYLDPK